MALTITDRGTFQTTAGGSITISATSSSFSVAASTVLVLGIVANCHNNSGSAGNLTFAVTDTIADTGGGAWTRQATCTNGSVANGQYMERLEMWTRVVGTSPGASKTVTASGTVPGGGTTSDDGWFAAHLWEVAGQDASPVGLTASPAQGPNVTTFNTDLGGTPAASSAVFGAVHSDNQTGPAINPPTSWTEDNEQSPAWGAISEWAHINGSSVQSPQWSGFSGTSTISGVAAEIKVATAVVAVVDDPLRAQPPGRISPVGKLTAQGDPNVRGQAVYPDQTVTATGTANSPTATVSPVPAQATGTATANLPGFTIAPNGLGVATGNATGQSPTSILAPNAGSASSTATANQPSGFTVSFTPAAATAPGTAQTPTPTVLVNAGIATATAAANDPTVQTSGGNFTNAQPAAATATATANNATNTVTPTLSAAATATATANQPVINTTGHTNAPAGVGTATATANLPGFTVVVNAGVAQATATANAPTGQLGPSPANAQAVAAAYITSAAVLVAGVVVATAQATANNATGFSGIVGTPKTETIVYRRPAVIKYRPR